MRRRRNRRPVNAAACALVALERLGRPAHTSEVAELAGYTVRRLRDVLRQLEAQGRVVPMPRARAWWRLA